ncbi:MAG TPA: DUF5615 family PIN-like protein, partial [Chloroflexi bacterium]|nr:DUF5615 family PIN-like protein [Chloroflexota bacterium]
HDLWLAAELGMSQAPDEQILTAAQAHNRILITRDKGFGNLVFVHQLGSGVIYLRIRASDIDKVHRELARALDSHTENSLQSSFMTVTAGGYRIRRLRRT